MGNYHLICREPFGNYTKGQMITDSDEVDKLSLDRDHHFNRIAIPAVPFTFTGPADEPSKLALELAPEIMEKPKAK